MTMRHALLCRELLLSSPLFVTICGCSHNTEVKEQSNSSYSSPSLSHSCPSPAEAQCNDSIRRWVTYSFLCTFSHPSLEGAIGLPELPNACEKAAVAEANINDAFPGCLSYYKDSVPMVKLSPTLSKYRGQHEGVAIVKKICQEMLDEIDKKPAHCL